MNNTEKKISLK